MMDGERRRDRSDRDRGERPPRTESEERRRCERRKQREERHRREKERIRAGGKKPGRGLDIIDKLDVTGIYGEGCEYYSRLRPRSPPADRLQYSTTTDPSMPATPIATRGKTAEHLCRPSRKVRPTWL